MSNSKLKVHRYAPRAGTAVAAATALFLSVLVGGVLSPAASAATTTTSEDFTAYAMAPLAQLTSSSDWSTFDSQLTAAKNEGIDGTASVLKTDNLMLCR